MPDIDNYNNIDMADIASINGQDVPEGGGGGVAESSAGLLYFEGGGFNTRLPDAQEIYGSNAVSLYKVQLSTRTDIVKIKDGQYHTFALDSSNNLYSYGYTNTGYMGRSTSTTPPEELGLTLTNVSKFAPHDNGCWAIKTDGTLWWCGYINIYANSGDTGTGSQLSNQSWSQFGSDTDWINIDAYPSYPYTCLAIKGGSGSEYLYSCGYNNFGRSGLGTTSGITKPWTRVKSAASTDWAETIDKISIGYHASMVVTKSGKFFAWGDANEGHVGQGTTTDYSYPVQVGTDTDWDVPYAKTRLSGYCRKTDGSLYGSRRSIYYMNIGPATSNRTYGQCGTDTDYEELVAHESSNSTGKQIIFAKKNGVWYANWAQALPVGSFAGNTAFKQAAPDNTWVTINSMLEGNDITVGINWIHTAYKEQNQGLGEVLVIATAAT